MQYTIIHNSRLSLSKFDRSPILILVFKYQASLFMRIIKTGLLLFLFLIIIHPVNSDEFNSEKNHDVTYITI